MANPPISKASKNCAILERLVCSPCCLPHHGRSVLLSAYANIGFSKYEGFSAWAAARHDPAGNPETDRAELAAVGLRLTSYHLPPVSDETATGIEAAVMSARYAAHAAPANPVVLFKATSLELLCRAAPRFLDAVEGTGVIPVLQNHAGSAISDARDFRYALETIDDPRMRAVLEVGHFARVGIPWREGWELLDGRIALIHLNDIRDGISVPLGTGDVDIPGLLKRMRDTGYAGDLVVEYEPPGRQDDLRFVLDGLRAARRYLAEHYVSC